MSCNAQKDTRTASERAEAARERRSRWILRVKDELRLNGKE